MPSVPLSELATITVGDERESISKTNGKDAVNVQIMKAQDANTVQVAKEAQNKIDEFVKNNDDIKATKPWILLNQLKIHYIQWLKKQL